MVKANPFEVNLEDMLELIGYNQFDVLNALEDNIADLDDLVEQTGLEKKAVRQNIEQLEDNGYIAELDGPEPVYEVTFRGVEAVEIGEILKGRNQNVDESTQVLEVAKVYDSEVFYQKGYIANLDSTSNFWEGEESLVQPKGTSYLGLELVEVVHHPIDTEDEERNDLYQVLSHTK